MKQIFKKAIVPLGAIASMSLPATMAVACGSSDTSNLSSLSGRDFSKEYDLSTIWSDVSADQYKEIVIKQWIDGDTLIYQNASDSTPVDPTDHKGVSALPHLRIQSIDTPESHKQVDGTWVDTTGVEKEWADKATHFGEQQIPVGTTVRVMLTKGATYGRDVGSIFYGPSYSKNYSVEILRAGLALNFINSVNYIIMNSRHQILHYLGIPLADAYNFAKKNKVGLHSIDPASVSQIHGTTSEIPVLYNTHNPGSVYSYMDVDFWKE